MRRGVGQGPVISYDCWRMPRLHRPPPPRPTTPRTLLVSSKGTKVPNWHELDLFPVSKMSTSDILLLKLCVTRLPIGLKVTFELFLQKVQVNQINRVLCGRTVFFWPDEKWSCLPAWSGRAGYLQARRARRTRGSRHRGLPGNPRTHPGRTSAASGSTPRLHINCTLRTLTSNKT